MNPNYFHMPVMKDEVIEYLITDPSGTYIDCTIGGAGHSLAILESLSLHGRLIGVDTDQQAIEFAEQRLQQFENQVRLFHANFSELTDVMREVNISQVIGILFDLGVSSHQIDNGQRGFSYLTDGPLDMRMNRNQKLTARDIVNDYSVDELSAIFKEYGEERQSRAIARAIVGARRKSPVETTVELSDIIRRTVPHKFQIKTLSRIFQAIRIRTNDELMSLTHVLEQAIPLLKEGGRLVVISYHSLEDKIVKNFLRRQNNPCTCPPSFPECVCHKKPTVKILTKHVVKPSEREISSNKRSRSARLRAAEKINGTT
ncbi:16S rRNA (cytosine(1402)-N(4))-methyltransferase RsmH [candidate division KSB1 bacterium]|nr:16S rRNA (cytosine(1402)-N(4))-methyltransferase RsmH [candidate division KSB1 bacterium]